MRSMRCELLLLLRVPFYSVVCLLCVCAKTDDEPIKLSFGVWTLNSVLGRILQG